MHSATDSASPAALDALLIARINTMRESMRAHKQKALAMWKACTPVEDTPATRVNQGKFTKQLVQCE